MARLSESNYQSRRIKLNGAIATATAAHMDVSMRREIDEATDADVKVARDVVTALTDRVAGLDAAFVRSQSDAAAEALELAMAAMQSSSETITAHLAKRTKEGAEIALLIDKLGKAYVKYLATGEAILKETVPHGRTQPGLVAALREATRGQFNDVRNAIGRELSENGLDMSGATAKGYASDHEHQRSVIAFTDRTNTGIEKVTSALFSQKEREMTA